MTEEERVEYALAGLRFWKYHLTRPKHFANFRIKVGDLYLVGDGWIRYFYEIQPEELVEHALAGGRNLG